MQQILVHGEETKKKSNTPKFDAELDRRKKELQEWKQEG